MQRRCLANSIFPQFLAFHEGVFRESRTSSLPTDEIRAPLKTPAWEATQFLDTKFSQPKNPQNVQPHYSQSSRENAAPSSGTYPSAYYKKYPPLEVR